jgi:hypothetical protein
MAAPHVTGMVALLMQAAGRPLSIGEIRNAVISSARSSLTDSAAWNSRYGYGRIDTVKTILTQVSHLPSQAAVADISEASRNGVLRSAPLSSISELLNSLFKGTANSRIQVRFELEIDPLGIKADK